MERGKRVILIIMDGWAHGLRPEVSAIAQGNTPFVDSLYTQYPHSELITHSESVGLPPGQMGNSEVGHLNIGAGRIVDQELMRINKQIKSGELARNPVLQEAFSYAQKHHKPLHLMGLVSDGGVHSHIDHLKALCDIGADSGLTDIFIHAFTDGRDTDPQSGTGFLRELEEHIKDSPVEIASVAGRYYAMDRDKRWERIRLAYDLLVHGKGQTTQNPVAALQRSYEEGATDEFVRPIVRTDNNNQPLATIREGDAVLCFNFRTDRCRQITMALTQQDFPEQQMQKLDLHYVTMTRYDETFQDVKVMLEKEDLQMTMGEVLEKAEKQQIRIAETEKYPHVTFFFSGGREEPFEGEKRILIPSPKVATYDLQPEMSANEVTAAILPELEKQSADFVCLNFANPDMVGHTGIFEAAVKAVETTDRCVEKVVSTALENEYTVFLTADHGNADYMVNEDGTPNTAHTKNPVPFFVIDRKWRPEVRDGKLGDIAPTVLTTMGLDIPPEMTGAVLL